ncbi:glycosyltransferase family 2 protein [Pseudooceanicola sp.]|uniref:glycosyltransferase family 2 protein n=1 Tax=Pseudooceanicola sp. TaxID=1914328 RepID=UPI0035C6FA1B
MTTWGIVSTIKAPQRAVLEFAAWHLEMGVHRLFLHLDAPDAATFDILKAHPRIRPRITDSAYWEASGVRRPTKHQPRQTFNATRTYARRADVDWLCHLDVDEFLMSDAPVSEALDALPPDCMVARVRPMEALAPVDPEGDAWNFKVLVVDPAARRCVATEVWPTYGPYLNGGFLSHVAGKIFVRTGQADPAFRIHNFYADGVENPGQQEVDTIALAHLHARTWADWYAHYRYRHESGAYRAELKPNRPRDRGGMTLHELFAVIEAEGGEAGLRLFFDEVCAATPGHLERLLAAGLLRRARMPLEALREKHFAGLETKS